MDENVYIPKLAEITDIVQEVDGVRPVKTFRTAIQNGNAFSFVPGQCAMLWVFGKGEAMIRVRWQTDEGKWTAVAQDKLIFCRGPRDDWGELFGVVEVPEDVGRLIILLGVKDQRSPEDVAWYDDVELYKLE